MELCSGFRRAKPLIFQSWPFEVGASRGIHPDSAPYTPKSNFYQTPHPLIGHIGLGAKKQAQK
jgi:hypothetical protein